jgi:hypothetical protein
MIQSLDLAGTGALRQQAMQATEEGELGECARGAGLEAPAPSLVAGSLPGNGGILAGRPTRQSMLHGVDLVPPGASSALSWQFPSAAAPEPATASDEPAGDGLRPHSGILQSPVPDLLARWGRLLSLTRRAIAVLMALPPTLRCGNQTAGRRRAPGRVLGRPPTTSGRNLLRTGALTPLRRWRRRRIWASTTPLRYLTKFHNLGSLLLNCISPRRRILPFEVRQ